MNRRSPNNNRKVRWRSLLRWKNALNHDYKIHLDNNSTKLNSLVRCANSWAIELNTRREIPYLRAPMYYSLYLSCVYHWTHVTAFLMSVHLQVITLIMTGVGLICSAIFYFGTKEPSDDSEKNRRSRVISDLYGKFWKTSSRNFAISKIF